MLGVYSVEESFKIDFIPAVYSIGLLEEALVRYNCVDSFHIIFKNVHDALPFLMCSLKSRLGPELLKQQPNFESLFQQFF